MFLSDPYSSNHSSNHYPRGTGMIEVVFGIFLFVAIACLGFDLYLILQGVMLNDALVTDAARAASMGEPAKLAPGRDRVVRKEQPPYKRVVAVVNNRKMTWPAMFELGPDITITETINPPVPEAPLGGPLSGSITIGTTIIIHPKSILSLLKMNDISLTASKTCPYTWVMKSQSAL